MKFFFKTAEKVPKNLKFTYFQKQVFHALSFCPDFHLSVLLFIPPLFTARSIFAQ